MEKWRGKIAVVTGASSGIGSAIAKDLANNGLTVIGLARRSERIEELSNQLSANCGGKIIARKCDISNYDSLKDAFIWIEENFSVIHILINNAGSGLMGSVLDPNEEMTRAINSTIDLNFKSLVHCTREATQLMNKSNDYCMIVNVSSVLGRNVLFPNHANLYPSTKHAVTAFSEVLRQDFIMNENGKIRVTNLSPGIVRTEIFENSGIEDTQMFFDNVPSLKPEDVSASVLHILSTPYNVNITELTIQPVGECPIVKFKI